MAIHFVLAAMTYVDIDAYHKYHDFAGVQGWVLIILKLILFSYYLYSILAYKSSVPKRSQGFYRIFSLLGAFYFMAVPGTILSSYFLQPYAR